MNKLESLITMPVYYLVIAGAIVLVIILFTCCCCKKKVIVERVKEVEVDVPVPVPVEPIVIGQVTRARDIVGRKRYNSGSEV